MPVTSTKTSHILQASATNAAGATTTGGSVDLTTAFGGLATARITNGAVAPTAACVFVIEVSTDGTTWHELSRQAAGTAADASYDLAMEVPPAVMHVRSRFTGNSDQDVTIEATFHELTSIG